MTHGNTTWADDRVDKLRELYAAGMSATEIAVELGLPTRNTVIGKINRLGLTRDKHNHRPGRTPRSDPRRVTTAPNSPWTAAKTAEFQRLYGDGLSDGDIAAELGFTRTMIQGKRKNLGLPSHFASPATRKSMRAAPHNSSGFYRIERKPEPSEAAPILLTIGDLREHHCRWPIGDPSCDTFRYCGAQKTPQRRVTAANVPGAGSPYCEAHHRLAYNGAGG
jgi:GcrA cell cycle regulator